MLSPPWQTPASYFIAMTAYLDLLQCGDPDDRHGLLLQLNAGKLDKALPKKLRENLEKRLTVSACPGSLHGTVEPVPAMSIGCAVPVLCSGHAALVPMPGACTDCTALKRESLHVQCAWGHTAWECECLHLQRARGHTAWECDGHAAWGCGQLGQPSATPALQQKGA